MHFSQHNRHFKNYPHSKPHIKYILTKTKKHPSPLSTRFLSPQTSIHTNTIFKHAPHRPIYTNHQPPISNSKS
ncbi:hypothetical protein Zm00014a_005786 [Zea mays]|uniref:Uncharacterized protein n=1 Tax=Zea mays TaxID=4577 RepID=A0A3L6FQ55_MAIZE|nr:hypothetical protein Zm00014a_005786 [Zea mays]